MPAYYCPKCAYDLRGTTGMVCPECGEYFSEARLQSIATLSDLTAGQVIWRLAAAPLLLAFAPIVIGFGLMGIATRLQGSQSFVADLCEPIAHVVGFIGVCGFPIASMVISADLAARTAMDRQIHHGVKRTTTFIVLCWCAYFLAQVAVATILAFPGCMLAGFLWPT